MHYGGNYSNGAFTGYRKAPSPGLPMRALFRKVVIERPYVKDHKTDGRTLVRDWTGAARDRKLTADRCPICRKVHPAGTDCAPQVKGGARGKARGKRSARAEARRKAKRARYQR